MVRITTVNPRGVAETHDVPGTIAGVAAAIVSAPYNELATGETTVRTAEIVMLQLLDFREPVVQPTPG